MKNKLLLTLFLFGLVVAAGAQAVTIGFSPRTGDVWVDTRLGDINNYGRGNPVGFIDDVVLVFGAPRPLVRDLYYDRGWAPGDIYYACALAQQLGRPCLEVVNYYDSNRGQGWGVVAQRLGIKPGSSAFHALKGRVGKGHDRMHGRGGPKASGGPKGGRDAGPPAGRSEGGGKPGKGDKGNGGKGNGKGR
ncbi:hypothetical protein [Arenimonas aestuarii]